MADKDPNLVRMSWDPITRIVGSLGIHTTIDFGNRKVVECQSTSSIFRGYSMFLRGKGLFRRVTDPGKYQAGHCPTKYVSLHAVQTI